MRQSEEVRECHATIGAMDYQPQVVVSGLDDSERPRKRINSDGGYVSIDTDFFYGAAKRTAFFPRLG
ncbi:hypothetical protein [Ruegeria marina]|uniref:hypothetical protein n=1 Tax=Ruegeria marina TaxID=639004 RepID=UPI003CCB9C6D